MSRIGRIPIKVPDGVTVTIRPDNEVTVKGPKGELSSRVSPDIKITLNEGVVTLERPTEQSRHRSQHGLARTLVNNMVQGVSSGYSKMLEVHGVGYRAQIEGSDLVLGIGFSHPVRFSPPEGIKFEIAPEERGSRQIRIIVSGIDKQKVGQVASDIRRVKPPDPYKGKGIRYSGEEVKLKQGKRATA